MSIKFLERGLFSTEGFTLNEKKLIDYLHKLCDQISNLTANMNQIVLKKR